MIRYNEAIQIIQNLGVKNQSRLKKIKIPLLDSVSKTSSQDVFAHEKLPAFANSSMDGFALKSYETQMASPKNPRRFKVAGISVAGDLPPSQPTAEFTAFEIMTGAPFHKDYDCCVKIEDCTAFRNSEGVATEIEISAPLSAGQNGRAAGEDFDRGSKILSANEIIRFEHILALAAFGEKEIEVFSPLQVALISTGQELVDFENTPEPGQIRNSTHPYLKLILQSYDCQVQSFAIVRDDKGHFKLLLQDLIDQAFDLVVTTGAVSMGKFDFIKEALEEMKAQIFFHKTAIRPGKPLLLSEFKNGPVVFSLPGNPVSGVVGIRFFIEKYFNALFSRTPEKAVLARSTQTFKKPEGLKCFFKARLTNDQDFHKIEILEGQMSFMISPLLKANAWAVLREENSEVQINELIDVYPMHFNPYQN